MMDTKLEFVLLSSITMVESVATTCKRHEKYWCHVIASKMALVINIYATGVILFLNILAVFTYFLEYC